MSDKRAIENRNVAMHSKTNSLSVESFSRFLMEFLMLPFNPTCSRYIPPSIHVGWCRFQKPNCDDEDLDNSYFRRKPTSFLSSNDAKRYTWMVPDDESIRMEGPRPIQNGGGPYVVGSYPPKSSFLSQSSEQITG